MEPCLNKLSSLSVNDNVPVSGSSGNQKYKKLEPGYGKIITKNVPNHPYSNINDDIDSTKNSCGIKQGHANVFSVKSTNLDRHIAPCNEVIPNEEFKYSNNAHALKQSSPSHRHVNGSNKVLNLRSSVPSTAEMLYGAKKTYPVYENLDYYDNRSIPHAQPNFHQNQSTYSGIHSCGNSQGSTHSSPRGSIASIDGGIFYESTFRKAQPQVPSSGRHSLHLKEYPPYDAPPVYENVQDMSKLCYHEPAKPGPQVPIQGTHKQIMNLNSDTVYSGICSGTEISSNNVPTAVCHQVITSPQRHSIIFQTSVVEAHSQQPSFTSTMSKHSPTVEKTSHKNSFQNTDLNTDKLQRDPEIKHLNCFPPTNEYGERLQRDQEVRNLNCYTPTNESALSAGKKLLPYNVTPPKPMVSIIFPLKKI